jgi:polar amino acid transport system substrate-binding protein
VPTATKAILASLTTLSVALVAGCSSGSASEASGDGDGGGYGECEVYGEAGSITLDPVTPGVLTSTAWRPTSPTVPAWTP